MTSCSVVYDAFLARISADDWTKEMILEHPNEVLADWEQLLNMAIFRFKYPRVDLTVEEGDFIGPITQSEIQLLALYMKHEWIKRCIANWENIRQLYTDKDFSQANFLDKLNKLNAAVVDEIKDAEGIYDRARERRPAVLFKKLAGKKNALQ